MRVEEAHLDWRKFNCCGDEDLYPFKCSKCNHIMVFCYECGTLYPDLSDTSIRFFDINHFNPEEPAFSCPNCHHEFEYFFMKNPAYHVKLQEWMTAGYEDLLKTND